MNRPIRHFDAPIAARAATPLLLGITGPSGSGKTFSAMRLATGIQRVSGGELFMIDTEANRGLHYADKFRFRHIDMAAPFSPLDYLDAIRFAVSQGAKVIVIDSMSHEHSGEGGVLDQSDQYLESKPEGDRDRYLMASLITPKKQRKKLNRAIEQLGREGVHMVLCYRAVDKIKPEQGKAPRKLGWQPDTTSTLIYEMTQRFLLTPGADGKPAVNPVTAEEKILVKNPEQFRGWFAPTEALSEDVGERMARWAAGNSAGATKPANAGPSFASAKALPWDRAGTFAGKPLASADLESLTEYELAVRGVIERERDEGRRTKWEQHLTAVERAIAAKEPPADDGDAGSDEGDVAEDAAQ